MMARIIGQPASWAAAFKEYAQNGRGIKRAARITEFLSCPRGAHRRPLRFYGNAYVN